MPHIARGGVVSRVLVLRAMVMTLVRGNMDRRSKIWPLTSRMPARTADTLRSDDGLRLCNQKWMINSLRSACLLIYKCDCRKPQANEIVDSGQWTQCSRD